MHAYTVEMITPSIFVLQSLEFHQHPLENERNASLLFEKTQLEKKNVCSIVCYLLLSFSAVLQATDETSKACLSFGLHCRS